ncbi:hypothetical protein SAMN02745196_02217 [Clostridium collagenovorans DSM 3089]|uniref:Uncharacterized protein n=1 Tax=Clostridium collagenovorans DSM 3089 TaxID=1121306 RepID=A0A1M5XFR0_9CLOT|nr:hypothetical protein [Clostridium collagenovorans]SHH98715.1 hypothetical protein SAMN02745196_02217 [Clostridium collagenovorans DSM 3089]
MEIINNEMNINEVGLSWACLVACGMSCILVGGVIVGAFGSALEAF